MKNLPLFAMACGMSLSMAAQNFLKPLNTKLPNTKYSETVPEKMASKMTGNATEDRFTITQNGRDESFIKIGSAENAHDFYGNPRTYVWADPSINSIVFTHAMPAETQRQSNGRIGYDVSTDGGITWTNNVQVYSPGTDSTKGRFPQGGILNPDGNTNPDSAFYTYFTSASDNSNGAWGGYAYGINPFTEINPPNPTQTNLTSGDGYYRQVPAAFHLTKQAVAWYADGSYKYAGANYNYTGKLILGQGEMVNSDIVYQEDLLPFMDSTISINDIKIAFAGDGQTGYILIMTDAASDPVPYTIFHPVLLKTMDGGESWSNPIQVQLGGENGIESIKNYFADSALINAGYPDSIDRNKVYYNMGYHADLAVDESGDPYITGIIAIGDTNGEGWYPYDRMMATWNVFSTDGGETWEADALYNNRYFQGDIGNIVQYNNPYVSSSYDGRFLFFSWLDTELDAAEQNDRPNIYVIGYDVEDNYYSDIFNVTLFTPAWNKAFFGSQSYYVFVEDGKNTTLCEIPFVYEEFTVPGDDTQQCDFWYIGGFIIVMPFPIGTKEIQADIKNLVVSQNQPNPATGITHILVTGQTDQPIQLTIGNMLGQVVYTAQQKSGALVHDFTVNVSDFDAGIYLYTVKVGNNIVTKKMMVK